MEAYLNKNELKKYLEGESGPYCREERQFAVFLYYIFLKEKWNKGDSKTKEIVQRCLYPKNKERKDIKIIDVYFEAALMRDYYEKNNNFNEMLLKFCLGWLGKEVETLCKKTKGCNLGAKKAKSIIQSYLDLDNTKVVEIIENEDSEKYNDIKEKACLDIARMMMNATPDILVIYKEKGEEETATKAKALECKYESDEGTYKDVAGAEYKMQLFIQECIMCFLFGKDGTDRWKRHIPQRPKSSKVWGKKKDKPNDKWEEICGKVYKEILNQEWGTEELRSIEESGSIEKSGSIKNAGVELIRFKEEKKKENYTLILAKDLMEEVYNNKSIS